MTIVYLAGPFFKPEQVACIDRLEAYLDKRYGRENVYSPRRIGILKPDATPEERARIFLGNVEGVGTCDLMVCVIDDFDPGSMVEFGVAWAWKKPVVAYSNVPDRGLNVMLSQAAHGFANGVQRLGEVLDKVEKGEVANTWLGSVQ